MVHNISAFKWQNTSTQLAFKARNGEAYRQSVRSSIPFGLTKRNQRSSTHYCTHRPNVETQRTPSSITRTGRSSRHGSVGIEARLTDGAIRGSKPGRGKKIFLFFETSRPGVRAQPAAFWMGTDGSGWGGGRFPRGVMLTSKLNIVQRLRISGFPVSLRGLYVAFYFYQHRRVEEIRDVSTLNCHF
jgi:hypothetical protein